eukprot:767868-Hanusia_phi.AAC.1
MNPAVPFEVPPERLAPGVGGSSRGRMRAHLVWEQSYCEPTREEERLVSSDSKNAWESQRVTPLLVLSCELRTPRSSSVWNDKPIRSDLLKAL